MLSIYGRLFLTASFFIGGTDAEGCKGGNTFNYGNEGYECNCNPVACTNETCVNDMGGEWTSDCPDCDPDECDPLAASDIDDPSCTGAPEMIDRFGKKMYRRKLIASEKPQDSEEGVFCHLTFELCGDESFITQGIDTGFGDYIRIAAADPEKWETYEGPINGKTYSGMNDATTARSYSPVNPLNEHKAQFIIKEEKSDSEENNCTPEENCKFGFSELACFAPVGTDFLLSVVPDHGGTDTTHYVYEPNFSREPGAGPYTVNIIGQGVAITELNVLGISELLEPFASDGSYSTIKVVNYLWANSYWSNAEWVFEKSESNDLARKLFQDMAQYGVRFNLMHAISREERPEAEFPRTNVTVIGDAFQLTNTTDQDPNIKWFVVGSGNYKKAIYPQIVEWGFDMQPCSEKAASKGYPYCGPNSLYEWAEMGYNGLEDRERSEIFKYSAGDLTTPSADANSADQIETDPYAGDPELSVDQSSGSSSDDNSESSTSLDDNTDSESSSSDQSSESSSHDNSESSHDNTDTCSTIFDLACSTDGFDTLCGLLTSFDLKDAISGGSWTVFAPTDEAFTKLDDALDGGIASVSDDLLLKILQFHVVDDQVLYSDDLPCELGNNLVTTLSGKDSRTFCEDDVPYGQKGSGNDEVVKFVGVDIDACNGVVHAVEDVLLFNLAPYM